MRQRVFAHGHQIADLRRRVGQTEPVLQIALVLAQLLGQLADAVAMLVDHLGVDVGLIQRRKVLALEVLDDGYLESRLVVDLLDESRDDLEFRSDRRPPAAFAGDELVAVADLGPDQDRLEDAVLPDRSGQVVQAGLVHRQAGLVRVRVDLVDGNVPDRRRPDDGRLLGAQEAEDVLGQTLTALLVEAGRRRGAEIWLSQAR